MTIDFTTDDELGDLLRAEVPAPGDSYWHDVHSMLAGELGDDENMTAAQPIDVAADSPSKVVPFRSRLRGGLGGTTALLVAAALLLIVGVLVGTRLNRSNETVNTGFATDPTSLAALPGPRQNRDHWHAVYGVWDCTLADGAGGWIPAFQSTQDDTGIHSHGDGMIYIHPFFEHSAGRNATFSHFVSEMNLELTDSALTLDDGRTLLEGTMCNGQKSVLHLRRWQSDETARTEAALNPRIITTDLNDERFYNDREVWILALAPIDADIPLPPRERFDALDGWSATPPVVAISASTLTALNIDVERSLEPPVYPAVEYQNPPDPEQPYGPAAVFAELIREPRPAWTDPIVADTFQVLATATRAPSPSVVLASYRITVGDDETRACFAPINIVTQQFEAMTGSSACHGSPGTTSPAIDENDTFLFMRNTPIDASYVVIETRNGTRIASNPIKRHIYVGADFATDPIAELTFFNSALQPIVTCSRPNPATPLECPPYDD